jgi:very-short-patch-repair endonuclease
MHMTDHDLVRRFARDHWVRLHGTPRVTFLLGSRRAQTIWENWSRLSGIESSLIEAETPPDRSIQRAFDRAAREPSHAIAILARAHVMTEWRVRASDRARTLFDEGSVSVDETDEVTTNDTRTAPPTLDARSVAEAILFDALEATAATRGRFELNGYLSVRFGADAAEVDLLARHDGIAIEIDGYYHFTDAEAYRRDRRKDVLLQGQGLFVLRFLAEDVMRDPTGAVNAICQALAFREGSR